MLREERGNRIFVIGSGENQSDNRKGMRGDMDAVLHSEQFDRCLRGPGWPDASVARHRAPAVAGRAAVAGVAVIAGLVSRTAIISITRFMNQGLVVISPILLVRLLTVEEFGRYREFLLYAGLLTHHLRVRHQ